MPHRRTVGAVGIEGQLAALALVEPGDAGGDRHPPAREEPRVVHGDDQPLGMLRAIDATELRHVGVDGELLSGHQQVGVDDGWLDERPSVQRARRLGEARVVEERLDPLDPHIGAIGVRLAEVVRPRGKRLGCLMATEAPTGANEVARRVPARRQPLADAREGRLLRVRFVGPEPLAERHHRASLVRREEWIEGGVPVLRHEAAS